jgi:hypothetical protein
VAERCGLWAVCLTRWSVGSVSATRSLAPKHEDRCHCTQKQQGNSAHRDAHTTQRPIFQHEAEDRTSKQRKSEADAGVLPRQRRLVLSTLCSDWYSA